MFNWRAAERMRFSLDICRSSQDWKVQLDLLLSCCLSVNLVSAADATCSVVNLCSAAFCFLNCVYDSGAYIIDRSGNNLALINPCA